MNKPKHWPWTEHESKEFQGEMDAMAGRPMKQENDLTGHKRAETYSSYVKGYKSVTQEEMDSYWILK